MTHDYKRRHDHPVRFALHQLAWQASSAHCMKRHRRAGVHGFPQPGPTARNPGLSGPVPCIIQLAPPRSAGGNGGATPPALHSRFHPDIGLQVNGRALPPSHPKTHPGRRLQKRSPSLEQAVYEARPRSVQLQAVVRLTATAASPPAHHQVRPTPSANTRNHQGEPSVQAGTPARSGPNPDLRLPAIRLRSTTAAHTQSQRIAGMNDVGGHRI